MDLLLNGFRLTALTAFSVTLLTLSLATAARAQNTPPHSAPAANDATKANDISGLSQTDRLHSSVTQNTQEAWGKLTDSLQDAKHPDIRIEALAALGTLGVDGHGATLIAGAMKDPDVDVRTAAVLSAGQTRNHALFGDLHDMLNDPEPQVAFTAATTLWKMNDRSGRDILLAVIDGDRRSSADLRDSTMHTVSRDLHSPSTLARIGALQGASMLLGPFGIGITAYEYMRKNGGNSGRVVAIEDIAQQRTSPVRSTLLGALGDKDPAVRAAAAKALGDYHERQVSDALLPLFDDSNRPVRLTAAAAYIRSTGRIAVQRMQQK